MFTVVPDPIEVTEGDDLQLACKAIGRPVPDISWYLGDELLSEDPDHVTVIQEEAGDENSSTVMLKNLLPDKHAGKYSIEAANSVGTATHTVKVTGETIKGIIEKLQQCCTFCPF